MKIQLQLVNVKENKCLLEEFCKMSLPPRPQIVLMGEGGGTFYKRGKKGAYITWDARKETAAKTTKQESRHPTPHVPNAKASSYVRAPHSLLLRFSSSDVIKSSPL